MLKMTEKARIQDDHEEDRLDHAAGGLPADAVGVAPGAKALEAADDGDDGGKHTGFADPDQQGGQVISLPKRSRNS